MGGHTHDAQSVKKEVRTYMMVFLALGILTIITVAISYLHLPVLGAVILALIVATIKAGLVAGFFMHLISERQCIYALLIFAGIFFVSLLFLPLGNHSDYITGTVDVSRELLAANAQEHAAAPAESHSNEH